MLTPEEGSGSSSILAVRLAGQGSGVWLGVERASFPDSAEIVPHPVRLTASAIARSVAGFECCKALTFPEGGRRGGILGFVIGDELDLIVAGFDLDGGDIEGGGGAAKGVPLV